MASTQHRDTASDHGITHEPLQSGLKNKNETARTKYVQGDSSSHLRLTLVPNTILPAANAEEESEDGEDPVGWLKSRLALVERNLDTYGLHIDEDDDTEDPESSKGKKRPYKRRPELHYVTWDQFKNKVFSDPVDYVIEVLAGKAKFYFEPEAKDKNYRALRPGDSNVQSDSEAADAGIRTAAIGELKEMPERIRITSRILIAILEQIDAGYDWPGGKLDVVLLRPYKLLVYYDRQIRDKFEELQNQWEQSIDADAVSVTDSKPVSPTNDQARQAGNEDRNQLSKLGDNDKPSLNTSELSGQEVHQTPKVNKEPVVSINQDVPAGILTAKNESQASLNNTVEKDPGIADESGARDETQHDVVGDINSREAFTHLRCLIQFMDAEIKPVRDRYSSDQCELVAFSDLWFLFEPGCLLYVPVGAIDGDVGAPNRRSRFQELWRVSSTAYGRPHLRAYNGSDAEVPEVETKAKTFQIMAFHYDFSGLTYGVTQIKFFITPFEGFKEITSLPIYPLRFEKNQKEIVSTCEKRNLAFEDIRTFKHMSYVGRSLISHPSGERNPREAFPKHSEAIDSHVIIDFKEALTTHAHWTPFFDRLTVPPLFTREFQEDYPLRWWTDTKRAKLVSEWDEYTFEDRSIDEKMADELKSGDRVLKDLGSKGSFHYSDIPIVNRCLLPNRVFAFVLRLRRFAMLTIDGLHPLKPSQGSWNDLILPSYHKTMVKSLVKNHFDNKVIGLRDSVGNNTGDLVRGKGKGLIILLHGAPGVGKTSTAECISELSGRLLLPITCGDLGLTASEVETELSEKFHMAEIWDCILLIDEADVFLAQRSRNDLQRNSLVSVFLRVLEYFTGILFLTTNRVGSFDEAFTSRIHIQLYYPPLEEEQTLRIWKAHLNRLKGDNVTGKKRVELDTKAILQFARAHFREASRVKARWNGRQIRNAFQTAVALAEYDAKDKDESKQAERARAEALTTEYEPTIPELKIEYFQRISEAAWQFDDYIQYTKGTGHSDLAYLGGERADDAPVSRKLFGDSQNSSKSTPKDAPSRYRSSRPQYVMTSDTQDGLELDEEDFGLEDDDFRPDEHDYSERRATPPRPRGAGLKPPQTKSSTYTRMSRPSQQHGQRSQGMYGRESKTTFEGGSDLEESDGAY